jgi:hypothetical protein
MWQLVKTKRQANFKGFKRFGAFKGLVEQKNVVFNSFVCTLGLFWHSWAFKQTNSSNKLLLRVCPNEHEKCHSIFVRCQFSGVRPVLQHLADASCFKFRPHTWKVIWQRYSYENNYCCIFVHSIVGLLWFTSI